MCTFQNYLSTFCSLRDPKVLVMLYINTLTFYALIRIGYKPNFNLITPP